MIEHRNWRGLASNMSPLEVPAGYLIEQTNLGCYAAGRLDGRHGLRPFDMEEVEPTTDGILSVFRFPVPGRQWIVYHNADGEVWAERNGQQLQIVPTGGLDARQPASYAIDRRGLLLIVNGMGRGYSWDGFSPEAFQIGIEQPAAGPTLNAGSGTLDPPLLLGDGTDLAINIDNARRVRSASFAFTASHIGHYLLIIDGVDFNTGWWKIINTVDGDALVDADIGTGGATGGEWELYYVPVYYGGYRYVDERGIVGNLSDLTEVEQFGGAVNWDVAEPSTNHRVVKVEFFRSTADQQVTLYKVGEQPAGGVVSVTNSSGTNLVTTNRPHGLTSTNVVRIAGVTGGSDINGSRTITVVSPTTFTIATSYSADGAGGGWMKWAGVSIAFSDGTLTDDDLLDEEPLPILDADDRPFARRHDVPPAYKPFIAIFQDTAFYYGNVELSGGTVSISGTAATFTGFDLTDEMAGWWLYVDNASRGYKIATVTNSTTAVLETAGSAATGETFRIRPEPAEARTLYWSEPDLPESVPAVNSLPVQENTQDASPETGLMNYGNSLWLLHSRALYRLNFTVRPDDGQVLPAGRRGCLNNRCWCVTGDDIAYLMDRQGVYRIAGSRPDDLSSPVVQDFFRDELIDFTNRHQFSVGFDDGQRVVRCYVATDGQEIDATPRRALCYSPLNGAWWLEAYHRPIVDNCQVELDGRAWCLLATSPALFYLHSDEVGDEVDPVRGQATGGTASTISDSAADYATDHFVRAPVAIIAGTGAGQIRWVSANTDTQLTVAPNWTTPPDATSVYLIGAVHVAIRTGCYNYEIELSQGERSIHLVFEPTAASTRLTTSLIQNRDQAGKRWIDQLDQQAGIANQQVDLSRAENYVRLVYDQTRRGYRPWERWAAVRYDGFQCEQRITLYQLLMAGVVP